MDECQQQLDFEELEKLCRHTPEDYISDEEEKEEQGNDVDQKVGAGGEEGGGIDQLVVAGDDTDDGTGQTMVSWAGWKIDFYVTSLYPLR